MDYYSTCSKHWISINSAWEWFIYKEPAMSHGWFNLVISQVNNVLNLFLTEIGLQFVHPKLY